MTEPNQNKPDVIIAAALDLFAENGFHCAPMSQVAAHAKVGMGSIYRYFKDKDELIHAVFEHVEEALKKTLREQLDATLSDRQQFIQLIVCLMQYLKGHPREFKFLEQYYSSPYGIDKKKAKFISEEAGDPTSPFINFFGGNQRGTVKNLPMPVYMALAFGPVTFLLRDSFSDLVVLDDQLMRQTAEACWDAIKA